MTRPAKTLLLFLIPLSVSLQAGCQRSMGGSMATGPFAPAGTGGTASAPLFPVGPINGATRVPPPPTGNASPNNGYNSPPSASNFGPGRAAATFQVNTNGANLPSNASIAANPGAQSPDAFRNSLGGMHVIDMTSGNHPPTTNFANTTFVDAATAAPIGSGVYDPARRPVETNAWAQQPADLLRPIDQPFNAIPVPRYRGMEGSVVPTSGPYATAVQPAGGFVPSDAWQSVPPQLSQSQANQPNVVQGGSGRAPIGQNSFQSPSPAGGLNPAAQIASPSLPWRSPTTAR